MSIISELQCVQGLIQQALRQASRYGSTARYLESQGYIHKYEKILNQLNSLIAAMDPDTKSTPQIGYVSNIPADQKKLINIKNEIDSVDLDHRLSEYDFGKKYLIQANKAMQNIIDAYSINKVIDGYSRDGLFGIPRSSAFNQIPHSTILNYLK